MSLAGLGPALPPNDLWFEGCFGAIAAAKSDEDFDKAFDNFVSKSADPFVMNGVKLNRAQFKHLIGQRRGLEKSASMKFLGVVTTAPKSVKETVIAIVVAPFSIP